MRSIAASSGGCGGISAGLAIFLAAAVSTASAQATTEPMEQVVRERLESLEGIKREPIELVVKARRQCASGQDPRATARSRALGAATASDSSDHCPAVLARIARDGGLVELYREMVVSLNGATDKVESLPAAIGVAAMTPGSHQVPIGNQRAAVVSAALAFDAGFTVAYQKGERVAPGMPGLAALKPVAERCLGLAEQDLGLCYSTGYVYGARAVNGQPLAGTQP